MKKLPPKPGPKQAPKQPSREVSRTSIDGRYIGRDKRIAPEQPITKPKNPPPEKK